MKINIEDMEEERLCEILSEHAKRQVDFIDWNRERDSEDPRRLVVTGIDVHWIDGTPDEHFSTMEVEDMIVAHSSPMG